MRARHLIAVLALTLGIAAAPAAAQGTYEFTDLSGGGAYLVTDINNIGDTVGSATSGGGQRGWVRRGGTITILQYLANQQPGGTTYGTQFSLARDINDQGVITGTATNGRLGRIRAGRHAVIWKPFAEGNADPAKPFFDLGVMAEGSQECNIGPPTIDCFTEGVAINEADEVAGYGEVGRDDDRSPIFYTLPFLSPSTRKLTTGTGTSPSSDRVTTDGSVSIVATGVNDNDQVVVWPDPAANGVDDDETGAVYTAGSRAGLPFETRSAYHPINNSGWVVGTSDTTGSDQAKLWKAGPVVDLPALPGDDETTAMAINNNGDVVGSSWGAAGGCHRAVKWPANDYANPIDLTARTATTWKLYEAHAINDRGDIAGGGRPDGICTGSYSLRPFSIAFPGIVVNDAGDEVDLTGGTGGCDAKPDDNDQCTLRAAIQTLNDGSARQRITFTVPEITPHSPLPAIERPVDLDGNGVVIDGTSAGATDGLSVQGGDSLLTSFVVKNFQQDGVHLASSDNVVGGCDDFACASVHDNGGAGVSVASGKERNTIRRVRLTANGGLAIDIGDDGRTPNTDLAGDFPVGVSETLLSGGWSVSGRAPRAPEGSTVDIYAQGAPGRAAPSGIVDTVELEETGWFGVTDTGINPSSGRFFSATVTAPDGTTSELSAVCGDPDHNGEPDNDRDGLCDTWETAGLDYDDDDTVDLQFQGAAPDHPDVYVEADAMDDLPGRTARPDPAIFDRVRAAFANAPVDVQLHVTGNGIDDTVPAQAAVVFDALGGSGTVQGIRNGAAEAPCDGYFGTAADRAGSNCWKTIGAKRLTHRWALFGYAFTEKGDASGIAQLSGDTLIVTIANWSARAMITSGGAPDACRASVACRTNIEAATLMHELGHTLGLHHGGDVDDNYKPNYLSIMNYAFQHQDLVADRPLDYSREQLPTLNEQALVEPAGIGAPPAAALLWPRTVIAETEGAQCDPTTVVRDASRVGVSSSGPVDFNQDGDTVDTVADRLLRGEDCFPQQMEGHDDWANLQYSFRGSPDVFKGIFKGAAAPGELSDEEVLAVASQTDIDGDGVSNLDESCRLVTGSEFADVDANGIADVCETAPVPTATATASATPSPTPSAGPGPGPSVDTVAPRLSGAALKPARLRRGRTSALAFTLSEAASVRVTATRLVKGRRRGKRCVAGRRKGKRCTLRKAAGDPVAANGKAGANTIAVGKGLKVGRYVLTIAASDTAGNRAAPLSITLRVVKSDRGDDGGL